jgi:hypothetical protein
MPRRFRHAARLRHGEQDIDIAQLEAAADAPGEEDLGPIVNRDTPCENENFSIHSPGAQ